jgi:hypothetical protein
MGVTASWTHGNVTELESNPSVTKTPRGWGAEFLFPRSPDTNSAAWLHVPIPTTVLNNDVRANAFRFFLLFACDPNLGFIDTVQLFDGPNLVQSFDNLFLGGLGFLNQILPQNTFLLTQPHSVNFGLSISFHYLTSVDTTGATNALLTVSTAGCDFQV